MDGDLPESTTGEGVSTTFRLSGTWYEAHRGLRAFKTLEVTHGKTRMKGEILPFKTADARCHDKDTFNSIPRVLDLIYNVSVRRACSRDASDYLQTAHIHIRETTGSPGEISAAKTASRSHSTDSTGTKNVFYQI